MARKRDKQRRRDQRRKERAAIDRNHFEDPGDLSDFEVLPLVPQKHSPKPIEAKTESQGHYIISIESNVCTFGTGPAGTGKTWLAAALAATALRDKKIQKIYITRPAETCEEDLGHLPGDIAEKFAPYFEPVQDALEDVLGKGPTDYHIKAGKIVPKPLGFMRGKSFKDCWIILDEAQNATPKQIKTLLTRVGHNCKLIINGDPAQKDRPGPCGLTDAMQKLKGMRGTGQVVFTREDCVRSGFCADVLERYEDS